MNRREKKRIELAQSAKNCVTKKEVRVGKANIKSHSNMGTSHLWSSFNAVHFSFLPISRPGVPALTSPAAAHVDHCADGIRQPVSSKVMNG